MPGVRATRPTETHSRGGQSWPHAYVSGPLVSAAERRATGWEMARAPVEREPGAVRGRLEFARKTKSPTPGGARLLEY